MKALIYQIKINAPKEKVWQVLADFGGVYKYSPTVKSSYLTSAQSAGVGTSRHCDLLPIGSIEERIAAWTEGEGYVVDIYEGKGAPPFKTALVTLKLEADGAGTRVTATAEYELKYGPIGAVMDAVTVNRFLKKGFEGLLAGLKHHVETGEEVHSTRGLQFAAVPV